MAAKHTQNQINHVALVLDASASMSGHRGQLVKVVEEQIAYLAQRSKELDQETRVSVYTFADQVECVIYDKDVLRLPKIGDYYRPGGMTALVEAVCKSQEDLGHVWEGYGEHSFLTFVLTDGMENASYGGYGSMGARSLMDRISTTLAKLPDHWTVGVLVPDMRAAHEAKRFGFPAQNVTTWNVNSSAGLNEAVSTIQRATDTFMQARKSGLRGTKNLFSMGEELTAADVHSTLQHIPAASYKLIPVDETMQIRDFVIRAGYRYATGCAFYELSKRETVQGTKQIAVVEKKTDRVFLGQDARRLVGLPDVNTTVKPGHNPDYQIFIQSTSVNRKLIPGTRLLLMV